MAATNAYVRVSRILSGGQPDDGFKCDPLASGNSAAFQLAGGKYGITLVASTYGTVTFVVLAGDGTTWLTATTAMTANGYATVDLPAGLYRVQLT